MEAKRAQLADGMSEQPPRISTRRAILERRSRFVRMAVAGAGITLAGTGCSGANAQPCLSVPAPDAGGSPPATDPAAAGQTSPARAEAASGPVKIGTAPARVGDRYRVSETIRAANGPKDPKNTAVPRSGLEGSRIAEEEVLAVAGGRKVRWRVQVVRDERRIRKHGQEERSSSPLAGNSYVVSYEGGQLKASRKDGAALPVRELRLLRGMYGPTQKPWRTLFDVLPTRVFEIGRPLELPPEAVKALNRTTFALSAMKITLRSVNTAQGVARFEHEIRSRVPRPVGEGTLPFTFTGGFEASLADGVFGRQVLEGRADYEQDGHPCVAERNITRVTERLSRRPEAGSATTTP